MSTDNINDRMNNYEKPELEVLEILLEGSILQDSDDEDPEFDIVPGMTDDWD